MLIRQHQIGIFTESATEGFARRLAAYLRKAHGQVPVDIAIPSVTLDSIGMRTLVAMVAECLEKGRRLGLTWESSLAAFTVLMFLHGPRFDESREIRAEMENAAVPRELLADHLTLLLPESVWQQARVEHRGGWKAVHA